MGQRANHYDAAFEAFLRRAGTPYVFVDEARRAMLQDVSLKSMDFIVYSRYGHNLLVDVKGRRFPSGEAAGGHKWESWATEDDLQSLLQWQQVFGEGFRAALVFAYELVEPRSRAEFGRVFAFRERTYAFYGVWADEYRSRMRPRSARWETVSLPSAVYRSLRAPIEALL